MNLKIWTRFKCIVGPSHMNLAKQGQASTFELELDS
ncbi:MAG: hypothetical protein ACI8P3_003956 [Saprospiraceae bacterium]|jgi:hypothetical protein